MLEVIPDRIEAGTYAIIGCITRIMIYKVNDIIPEHNRSINY